MHRERGGAVLIDLLREVFRRPPRPAAHDSRANQSLDEARAAIEQGRFDDAIMILRRAAIDEPENPAILLERARVARDLGLLEEAVNSFAAARRLLPESVEIVLNLGVVHEASGSFIEAQRCYEEVIARRPTLPAAHLNLGNVRRTLGNLAGAAASYEQVLRLQPDSAKAHGNLANLHKLQGDLESAEAHFMRAITFDGNDLRWLFGLGATLHDMDRLDGAIAVYETILERAPADIKARHNLAYALLARGDFARGWPATEIRFELVEGAVRRHACSAPHWRGEPIEDDTLLVWGEQGVGDEILFAGMYADLVRHARRVVIECQAKLQPLFARSFPWAMVVASKQPNDDSSLPRIDRQIAAGSLGALFRASLDTFPARRGYLIADASRVARWRARLDTLGDGLTIGFCWRSSNLKDERALSCARIDQWERLFRLPGLRWVCLQYDECAAELDEIRRKFGIDAHRFDEVDYFDDLDEVSALTSALDLVISAPTTVSVLSAALGVETWQLSFGCDWQTHGTDSNPWFPSMVRFQRRWDQTWPQSLQEVEMQLHKRVKASRDRIMGQSSEVPHR